MNKSKSRSEGERGKVYLVGAGTGDLMRLVASRGLRLTALGIVIGVIAAFVLTRLMGDLLYKVNPRDPVAFGLAVVVIIFVSLAACFLPAWRATRVDPVQALRDQ